MSVETKDRKPVSQYAYDNDHGRYKPEDPLDPVERGAVGKTAARLHIHLNNIFVCRESLEIAAGALQRALVVSHQSDVAEKHRLFEIRAIIDVARNRLLDLGKGRKDSTE